MANEAHFRILKDGWRSWNEWREQQPTIIPDLSGADLQGIDLGEFNLMDADLSGADLSEANLRDTNFCSATLRHANLSKANLLFAGFDDANLEGANLSCTNLGFASLTDAVLNGVNFSFATLRETNFFKATLRGANLSAANLRGTNFTNADLSQVDLSYATFSHVILNNTNFAEAVMVETHLADLDLRSAKGLEDIIHRGPSHLSISTLLRSQGMIPVIFLRGVGLEDASIAYAQSFIHNPVQYRPCFISYESTDEAFARRLHADLQKEGIRCWLAPHLLASRSDDPGSRAIDYAIHMYHKLALILVLSKDSTQRGWIPVEIGQAGAKESKEGIPVVFPIQIDNTIIYSTLWWVEQIKRRYSISDFTQWKDEETYRQALSGLLEALRSEKQLF